MSIENWSLIKWNYIIERKIENDVVSKYWTDQEKFFIPNSDPKLIATNKRFISKIGKYLVGNGCFKKF